MDPEGIIKKIDRCISSLEAEFKANPSYFFTENDLLCKLYQLVSESIPNAYAEDVNGVEHRLIHAEHPTPFRCSMAANGFELKADDERTPKKGKFKRGHFDLVFLNPVAVAKLDYRAIIAQDYQVVKEKALPYLTKDDPLILYALEIQYGRSPMKTSHIKDFIEKAIQDHEKLKAVSCNSHGEYQCLNERYVKEYGSIAFISNNNEETVRVIEKGLLGRTRIKVVSALP